MRCSGHLATDSASLLVCTAGDPSLGSPVLTQSSVATESDAASSIMNTAELQDYLAGRGEWAAAPDVAGTPNAAADAAASSIPDSVVTQHYSTLGRTVAELAAYAQKLRGLAAAEPPEPSGDTSPGPSDALAVTAADAASQQVDAAAQTIRSIPLRIAVVSLHGQAMADVNGSSTLQKLTIVLEQML